MNEHQTTTLLMATQLALYALGWALCAWRLVEARRHALNFLAVCVIGGAALGLVSQRGRWPGPLTDVGAQVLMMWAIFSMWHALDHFGVPKVQLRSRLGLMGLASAAILLLALEPTLNYLRVAMLYSFEIVILIQLALAAKRALVRSHRDILAWPVVSIVWLMALVLGARAVQVMIERPVYANMDQPGATNVALLWVSMVGFTVLNMVFAFVIIASLVARLDSLSREDALTGLNNRRAFNEVLAREWSRRTRESSSFSLVAFDIDHFKRINDQHGHAVGDEVLVQLAQLVSGHARQSDYVARIGGEEFVMLLPSTGVSGAALLADRLREAVLYADWPKGHRVTISVGVACSRFDDVSAGDLLVRADQAMYQAKARGRNQTIVHSPLHSARSDGVPASAKTPALFA